MYETSSSECKRLFEVSILQNYFFIIYVPVLKNSVKCKIDANTDSAAQKSDEYLFIK